MINLCSSSSEEAGSISSDKAGSISSDEAGSISSDNGYFTILSDFSPIKPKTAQTSALSNWDMETNDYEPKDVIKSIIPSCNIFFCKRYPFNIFNH